MVRLFAHLSLAAFRLSAEIRNRGITRLSGRKNVHDEHQLALDVIADDIFFEELEASEVVAKIASEEQENEINFEVENGYAVAYDPLDGSSLVDTNLAVGSIFGVYKEKFRGQTGRKQVAAGFFVYGPRTTLVFSLGDAVCEAMLLPNGDTEIRSENLKIAPEMKQFSPGNLRAAVENPQYKAIIDGWIARSLTLRYSGGMVPDLNSIFLKGHGLFSYPSHSKCPNGKLRLLYECAPMAFLAEAAEGAALDEKGISILDKKIGDLHERTTIFVGSKTEVENAVATMASSSVHHS